MKEDTKHGAWFLFHLILWFTIIPLLTMHFIVAPLVMESWEPTEYKTVFDWDECMAEPPFETTQVRFVNRYNVRMDIHIEFEDGFQGRDLYTDQVIPEDEPYGMISMRVPTNHSYEATLYHPNETVHFNLFVNHTYTNIIIYADQIWKYTKVNQEFHGENNEVWWEPLWEHRELIWEAEP